MENGKGHENRGHRGWLSAIDNVEERIEEMTIGWAL